MRRLLARGLAALARDRASVAPRPDYGAPPLLEQLERTSDQWRTVELDAALAAHRRGDIPTAIQHAVAHFASNARPKFFVDAGRLSALANDPWLERARESSAAYAHEATTRGLAIYALTGPPLRAGFPWGDPLGSRSRDLLFAAHPHRFAFLPPLTVAAATGGLAIQSLTGILDDWMRYAERDARVPFASNLVVTQRVIACAWAFALAGIDELASGIREQLLRILRQDVAFLVPRLGHSVPNNHLLVDRFAAWFIALLLPELARAPIDLAAAETAWLTELERQTYEDGGSFEHSTHYHRFACEMAAGYLLLSALNDRTVPDSARQRIGRMLELQASLCGDDGHAPAIGDSSDDPLFALDGRSDGSAGALREVYRALFDPHLAVLDDSHPGRLRAWWLLGGRLSPTEPVRSAPLAATFPLAGLAVLDDNVARTRWTFRMGPVSGTRYHPGHQHADALSVSLVCDGIPMVVDAGTFTYRITDARGAGPTIDWRKYFAGPAAHNGLVVDGTTIYPPLTGDFRESKPLPEVRVVCTEAGTDLAVIEARFDGHSGHPSWARGVIGLRGSMTIVYDLVGHSNPPLRASLRLQWAPECTLSLTGERSLVACAGKTGLRLAWSNGLGPGHVAIGNDRSLAGWVSPRYAERVAAPQLSLPLAAGGKVLTAMTLARDHTSDALSITCTSPTPDVRSFCIESSAAIDHVWLNVGTTGIPLEVDGLAFDGRLAWIRMPRHGVPVVRWLGGRALTARGGTVVRELPGFVAEYRD